MKKILVPLISIGIWGCASTDNASGIQLNTDKEKSAYAVGYYTAMTMARAVKDQGIIDDVEPFIAAFATTVKGEEENLLLNEEDLKKYMDQHQERYKQKVEAEKQAAADANQKAGDAYRAANAQREGVVILESGLQYEVLSSGTGGEHPTPEDTIIAHYHGTLPDGTVFDSSVEREEPISFSLKGVIPGWKEAIPMMSVGDKWRVVLPPDLAYGENGMGQAIGPNTTLTFEIEIIDLNPET
jgi:FKBP-type peptidyl-prolyl cis-trans isomerase FklB